MDTKATFGGKKKLVGDPSIIANQMEIDLQTMMKMYKKMERDKRISNTNKFSKQTKVIAILNREMTNVKTDLIVATGSTNLKKNSGVWKEILRMLRDYDKVNQDIKTNTNHLREIEYQIKRTANQVRELQGKQITDVQHQTRVLDGHKVVEKLENRLCSINRTFCTILTENRKLREEIDHYLLERSYFTKLWERYVRRLNMGKKIMLDLIEQATIAYDQREEWCTNLLALRTRASNDRVSHTTEMSYLQRDIDHNNKMKDFLMVKNQKRLMTDLHRNLLEKREMYKDKLFQQVIKYRKMLDDITQFTEEENMTQLSTEYMHNEEENFAKYLYANELTKQMEGMSQKLAYYRKKVDIERKINDDFETQQKRELDRLRNNLEARKVDVAHAEMQCMTANMHLSSLLSGIEKIFKICKCSNAPLLELLGDNAKLSQYNARLYLNVIEGRVSEMLRTVYLKQKTLDRRRDQMIRDALQTGQRKEVNVYAPRSPCPLCIETAFCSDIIEKLQKALTKDEVTYKLNNYLAIPNALHIVHNVSECHLPKSRQIIQKRYQ